MKDMRCRKHSTDFSSAVGVCAPCLRERLFAIIAAQTLTQSQKQVQQDFRKSETQQVQPIPFPFPRSVSPYISRRKSDTATAASTWRNDHIQRFYCTPQVGPTGSTAVDGNNGGKSKGGRFSSLFLGLFRSKQRKPDSGPISDLGVPVDSYGVSPSWFSAIVPRSRKKQNRAFSVGEGFAQRNVFRKRDRGMSPARYSDAEDEEHCHGGSSGYSSESSPGWKQTPRRTPAAMRRGGSRAPASNGTNLSAFCLSPLVRPSPNRRRSQKCTQPETVVAGESRVPAMSHLSTAPSFCKNRSRKLADIGRYNNYNPNYWN